MILRDRLYPKSTLILPLDFRGIQSSPETAVSQAGRWTCSTQGFVLWYVNEKQEKPMYPLFEKQIE